MEVRRESSDPELVVRVRRGTLRSRACRGVRRCTLIQRLLFGSGGNHSDHELAVKGRHGPVGNVGLLFGSGGELCDRELAVEVHAKSRRHRSTR